MAYLSAVSSLDSVVQWEVNDAGQTTGGPGGGANAQAQALINRIKYYTDGTYKAVIASVATVLNVIGTDGQLLQAYGGSVAWTTVNNLSVAEYANLAAFPATGLTTIIYKALDTGSLYRWFGTGYSEIPASLVLGETSTTAYRGDRGKIAYDAAVLVSTAPAASKIPLTTTTSVLDGWISDASTSVKGKIQTTTTPSVITTGTDTTLALTAAALKTSTPQLSGVAFPATQVPSADANTLDDYEEGTWTPGLTFGGGNTGLAMNSDPAVNGGTYVKLGRKVRLKGRAQILTKGTSTGVMVITGLPFTRSAAITETAGNLSQCTSLIVTGIVFLGVTANTATIGVFAMTDSNAGLTALTDAAITESPVSVIRIDIEYFV